MPTVLRHNGFRFYFYSHEPNEPPHVHVDKDGYSAKLWMEPVEIARNYGFTAQDLRFLINFVRDHREIILETWHGYFSNSG